MSTQHTTNRLLSIIRIFLIVVAFIPAILIPSSTTHAMIPRETRLRARITDGLIRLSVGIEDTEALITDLAQALAKI